MYPLRKGQDWVPNDLQRYLIGHLVLFKLINLEELNVPPNCNSGLKNSINLKLGKEVRFYYIEKIIFNV